MKLPNLFGPYLLHAVKGLCLLWAVRGDVKIPLFFPQNLHKDPQNHPIRFYTVADHCKHFTKRTLPSRYKKYLMPPTDGANGFL